MRKTRLKRAASVLLTAAMLFGTVTLGAGAYSSGDGSFAGSAGNLAVVTDADAVSGAITDADNARLVWATQVNSGWANATTNAVILDDRLYVVGQGEIKELNPATGDIVKSTPLTTGNGYTYFLMSGGGLLYVQEGTKVEAFTSELEQQWQVTAAGKGSQGLCQLYYADGALYGATVDTGKTNGSAQYFCLNTADGSVKWQFDAQLTNAGVSGYTGSYWAGGVVIGDYVLFGGEGGRIYCLDKATGAMKSAYDLDESHAASIRSALAWDGAYVYFTANTSFTEGGVYRLDFDEDTGAFGGLASCAIGYSRATPTVCNGRIYVTGGEQIHVIDAVTMAECYTAGAGSTDVRVITDGDTVYGYTTTNNANGTVACIKDTAGQTQAICWDLSAQTQEHAQYCASQITIGGDGSLYYTNDSGYVMKLAKNPTVYVTLSTAGTVAKGKDGTLLANAPVVVKDLDKDGSLTVDEALYAVHEAYYAGGAAEGYASADSQWGLSLTELWGDTSGSFGYWLNDASCWSLADPVSDGDYLTAFVYADQVGWSDIYTGFAEKDLSVTLGETVTLTVNRYDFDMDTYSYLAVPAAGITVTVGEDSYTTDADGQVSLRFTDAGTYTVIAAGEGYVPTACTVDVQGAVVYATISNAGTVVAGADDTLLANAPVVVKDLDKDGSLTVDEALYAAHEAYYAGGAAEGYASADSQWGLSLTKLWGDTSGSFGYWLNDASCWSLADPVSDGDYLTAFVYADQVGWSDIYTGFAEKDLSATLGETVTLTVNRYDFDMDTYGYVAAPAAGIAVNVDGRNFITDSQGKVEVLTGTAGAFSVVVNSAGYVPAAATLTVKDTALPFADIQSGDWFKGYVAYAYANGIMIGVAADEFAPDSLTTRAAAVTVLYRMAGEPEVTGASRFTDVTQDWYRDAVIWCEKNGITNGVSETEFAPDTPVTREQLVTLLYRYAVRMGYPVLPGADLSRYGDVADISEYALEAVQWANAAGILMGVSNTALVPQGNSSRAVLATVAGSFVLNIAR